MGSACHMPLSSGEVLHPHDKSVGNQSCMFTHRETSAFPTLKPENEDSGSPQTIHEDKPVWKLSATDHLGEYLRPGGR